MGDIIVAAGHTHIRYCESRRFAFSASRPDLDARICGRCRETCRSVYRRPLNKRRSRSLHMSKYQAIGLCIALASISRSSVIAQTQTDPPIEWSGTSANLPSEDKQAVITLAKQMGIDSPRRVSESITIPLSIRTLMVSSTVQVNGNQRTWRELQVCRSDWPCARAFRPGAVSGLVGMWLAIDRWLPRETWRIHDGDWSIDLALSGVSYKSAELIVIAIRRQALIDSRPAPSVKLNALVPPINAAAITGIRLLPVAGEYEVQTGRGGGGLDLRVRIDGTKVELLDASSWIA
jgi:hypothetical protein